MATGVITLDRFLASMSSEWVVVGYSVDDNGKLRVHYICKDDPGIEWSHNPYNELITTVRIGTIGMLGFIPRDMYPKFAPVAPRGKNDGED